MEKNRRATSVLFGFDFQVNSSIVLMLENIKELDSLRLEGNNEDIEIKLNDGSLILAQAKSVEKSSSDFRNVINNFKKSLHSLSDGDKKSGNTIELIMITNSPNPLNDISTFGIFSLDAHRNYESLPESLKIKIQNFVNEEKIDLDLSKFKIQILPFETDDERERYKFVKKAIEEFISDIDISDFGISKKLMSTWQNEVFKNGSKKDVSIELSKRDIVWPMIVILIDPTKMDSELAETFDEALFDEINRKYSDIIEVCSEKYEFFAKVLYDYNSFIYNGNMREKTKCFISSSWINYKDIFNDIDDIEEVKEGLIKIILNNIIRNRIKIDKIKSGVGL